MDKIIHIKQFLNIPDDDFILLTKLTYPDHVQKCDRLHKSTCYTLKPTKTINKMMPKNKNYYHIKSTDRETLAKYKDSRCSKC